jgi:hypothetical protein
VSTPAAALAELSQRLAMGEGGAGDPNAEFAARLERIDAREWRGR